MSDESGNEDSWLYGDSINPEPPEINDDDSALEKEPEQMETQEEEMQADVPGIETAPEEPTPEPVVVEPEAIMEAEAQETEEAAIENGVECTENEVTAEENGEAAEEEDDDDSEDDDVQVVIGDIKATTNYTSLNIKRGGLLTSAGTGDKLKQPGKFSIEEFETVGTINGQEAIDFNLDALEDKPWRKPGADITDYFNYGFNEETWRSYCERQKRIRVQESGVGLTPLGGGGSGGGIQGRSGLINVAISNDNSKYSTWEGGFLGQKKAGPPPGRRYAGSIDVIGGGGLASRRGLESKGTPPKENVIQVMTADRRDYSRKPGFPDMTMPPPPAGMPPPFDLGAPPPHNVIQRIGPPVIPPFVPHLDPYGNPIGHPGPPHIDFYQQPPEVDPYYQSYEPTQDCQWNDPLAKTWQPTSLASLPIGSVKVLTPVVPLPPEITSEGSAKADAGDGVDGNVPVTALGVVIKEEPKDSDDRTKERKDRSDRTDKHKDRSHRHRSRSRSQDRRRRHKSRSRSPHRSHRKSKKSRKSKDDSE